jgi:cell wall-associated NlpC family hydrolase
MQMTAFRLVNFLIILALSISCAPLKKTKSEDPVSVVLREARTYAGAPYKWGGNSKKGIDCSGLTCQSFKAVNIALPRTADAQALLGKRVDKDDVRPGDLVFFTKDKKSKEISHVGLVTQVKQGDIIFINATTKKGVIESKLSEEYWKIRYWGAKRVVR